MRSHYSKLPLRVGKMGAVANGPCIRPWKRSLNQDTSLWMKIVLCVLNIDEHLIYHWRLKQQKGRIALSTFIALTATWSPLDPWPLLLVEMCSDKLRLLLGLYTAGKNYGTVFFCLFLFSDFIKSGNFVHNWNHTGEFWKIHGIHLGGLWVQKDQC